MSGVTPDEWPLIWPDYTGPVHVVRQFLIGDACPQCDKYDHCEYHITDSRERPGYYLVGAFCRSCGGYSMGYQPDPERLHPDDWAYR